MGRVSLVALSRIIRFLFGCSFFQSFAESWNLKEPEHGADSVIRVVRRGQAPQGRGSLDRVGRSLPNSVLILTPWL